MKAVLTILTLCLTGCAAEAPQAYWQFARLESIRHASDATEATHEKFWLHYAVIDGHGPGWDVIENDTVGRRIGTVEKILIQRQ